MLAAGAQVVAVFVGTGRDGFELLSLRVVILAVLSQTVLLRTVLVWNALAVVEDLSEQTDAGVGEACQLLDAQAVLFSEVNRTKRVIKSVSKAPIGQIG